MPAYSNIASAEGSDGLAHRPPLPLRRRRDRPLRTTFPASPSPRRALRRRLLGRSPSLEVPGGRGFISADITLATAVGNPCNPAQEDKGMQTAWAGAAGVREPGVSRASSNDPR